MRLVKQVQSQPFGEGGHLQSGRGLCRSCCGQGTSITASPGTIMNIATTADITGTGGTKYAGGIAGEVSTGGAITHCRNAANAVRASFNMVTDGSDTYYWFCGGIAGYIRGHGKVTYGYVKAAIRNFGGGGSGDGMRYTGGIAGATNDILGDLNDNSTITNCVSLSEYVLNNSVTGTGGIIGGGRFYFDDKYNYNFTHDIK